MSKVTDALEDLVPFAEAILALKTAQVDLDKVNRDISNSKTVLTDLNSRKEAAIKEAGNAKSASALAKDAELAAKRGIVEATAEREAILAKAKADAQAAYDAQLTQKQEKLAEMDSRIQQRQEQLAGVDLAVKEASARLAGIETQISTLKNRFG